MHGKDVYKRQKWNNIKRKKEKTDSQKAKIFTKMGREIAVAVKEGGGPDPASNSKLKDAIAKAKANNVPNDNIDRIIKKAAGEGSGDKYEALQYEGYGPVSYTHLDVYKRQRRSCPKSAAPRTGCFPHRNWLPRRVR